jgi:hypothetical protein
MRDLKSNLAFAQSLAPDTRLASANGTGVDLSGADAAMVEFNVGLLTTGEFAFSVEESDNDSSYSAVADADLAGTEPTINDGADDNQVYKVNYLGTKRYIRAVLTVTAQSPSILVGLPCSATVVTKPNILPAS